nr:MAG TPA: hypothetical protein [Caudoviricetes sp.]
MPSAPRSFRFARYPIKRKNHNGIVTILLHAPNIIGYYSLIET